MKTCQNCGAYLFQELASGLCPKCLIQVAQNANQLPDSRGFDADAQPLTPEQLRGRIPGIDIVQFIGRGGMGAVYRAHQVDLDRPVAVKILPVGLASDPVFVERFRQEARALAKIDHPNIVSIFGSGIAGELCYIVMELIEGVTLRQAIAKRSIDPTAALRIIPQICNALEYAHSRGIVHRDIKPENILLGQGGKVKVADFGLAKLSTGEPGATSLTMTGARLGTLRYMAPEQFDGEDVDHRSDIYALGVVIYELLTGRVPMGHFPPPSDTPGVDPRIDAVVMRTLQSEPNQRYQTASEIETELYQISQAGKINIKSQAAKLIGKTHLYPSRAQGHQWKSNATFFGYPLLHIAYGYDPQTQQKLIAKGVIAIGDVACGGLAIGGAAFGLLSLGGFSVGLTALGGAAIGLQAALGGVAVGGFAIGGGALGLLALGGGAIGLFAAGGGAIGYLAMGGGATGTYTYDYRGWSDPAFAETWLGEIIRSPQLGPWLTAGMVLSLIGPLCLVLAAVLAGILSPGNRSPNANRVPNDIKGSLLQNSAALIGLLIGAIFILPLPARLTRQLQESMQKNHTTHAPPMNDVNKQAATPVADHSPK